LANLIRLNDGSINIADLLAKSEGQLLGLHQFTLNCTAEFSTNLATESVSPESGAAELAARDVAIKLVGIKGRSALDIELHTARLSLVAEQIAGNDIAVAAKMIGPEGRVSGTLSLSAMEGSLSDLRGGALLVELEAVKNDWTIHTVLESPPRIQLHDLAVESSGD
jgi:hypothetical protein